jgi:hypothetical protein
LTKDAPILQGGASELASGSIIDAPFGDQFTYLTRGPFRKAYVENILFSVALK